MWNPVTGCTKIGLSVAFNRRQIDVASATPTNIHNRLRVWNWLPNLDRAPVGWSQRYVKAMRGGTKPVISKIYKTHVS